LRIERCKNKQKKSREEIEEVKEWRSLAAASLGMSLRENRFIPSRAESPF
jgi:hypothetical protein